MKYTVHIYMTVRVQFDGIEADSQLEAARKAAIMVDEDTFRRGEYADEITAALVDEEGDEEHERSHTIEAAELFAPADPITA